MKLLLDQNLSHRLVARLQRDFAETTHVRTRELSFATDEAIWDLAQREGFVIVSKDEDFHQRSLVHGAPPKFIWLRVGNCSTSRILDLLIAGRAEIEQFVAHEVAAFLVLE